MGVPPMHPREKTGEGPSYGEVAELLVARFHVHESVYVMPFNVDEISMRFAPGESFTFHRSAFSLLVCVPITTPLIFSVALPVLV